MRNTVIWQSYRGTAWWPMLLFGVALVAFALLVLIHPELLAYLVAFFLMTTGFGIIGAALALRSNRRMGKSATEYQDVEW